MEPLNAKMKKKMGMRALDVMCRKIRRPILTADNRTRVYDMSFFSKKYDIPLYNPIVKMGDDVKG